MKFLLYLMTFWIIASSQEVEIPTTAVEGLSQNVLIDCGFPEPIGPILWIINETLYDLDSISLAFVALDSITTLKLQEVCSSFSNTTFQCLPSTTHELSRVTRLFVEKVPNVSIPSICSEEGYKNVTVNVTNIRFNESAISENNLIMNWGRPQHCADYDFYLLVYDNIHSTPTHNISITCCESNFSAMELYTSENNILYFKIVGLKDGAQCDRHHVLYTFNASNIQDSIIIDDEPVCYRFPSRPRLCDESAAIYFVLSEECKIEVYPRRDKQFKNFCLENFNLFNISINHTSMEVCLSNWTREFDRRSVFFSCSQQCNLHKCHAIRNVFSPIRIMRGTITSYGSPTIQMTSITLNSSNVNVATTRLISSNVDATSNKQISLNVNSLFSTTDMFRTTSLVKEHQTSSKVIPSTFNTEPLMVIIDTPTPSPTAILHHSMAFTNFGSDIVNPTSNITPSPNNNNGLSTFAKTLIGTCSTLMILLLLLIVLALIVVCLSTTTKKPRKAGVGVTNKMALSDTLKDS